MKHYPELASRIESEMLRRGFEIAAAHFRQRTQHGEYGLYHLTRLAQYWKLA